MKKENQKKSAPSKPATPKKSPYQVLTNWLLTSRQNEKLDEWVIPIINPIMALCMLGRMGKTTIYLNEFFNDYKLYKLDKSEFFYFLRDIVQKLNLTRRDLTYLKYHKEDRSLDDIHKKFPTLKRYELIQMISYSKKDKSYDEMMYSLNLSQEKAKKRKVTRRG